MIYATPFDPQTRECTAPSTPAGFETLNQVRVALGTPTSERPAMLIYDCVMFTRLHWRTEK